MNPLKCIFKVMSVKFLGFIVHHRGVEVEPVKIKTITRLPPLTNRQELKGFQGRITYIWVEILDMAYQTDTIRYKVNEFRLILNGFGL